MKKVLWICNIMLPPIAKELGLPYSNREGWLSGIYEKALQEELPYELRICFPMNPEDFDEKSQGWKQLKTAKGIHYAFAENLSCPEKYDPRLEKFMIGILDDFKPDMIHIFGTEFPHTLAAVRAFADPGHTLIGIQGLCYEIANCYQAGLPDGIFRSVTFRDVIRRDSMRQQQKKFQLRGKNEVQAIQGTGNLTGRTVFDRERTQEINPHARYFSMNETMREEFYEGNWEKEKAEPYRIFLAQGDYPLKGLHILLDALSGLKRKYPSVKLYVAGNSILEHKTIKEKLKLCAYGKYLLERIKEERLEQQVVILGKLSAEEMKHQFLKCSVFVCASVLENSPNTVAEAMLLGVPVVASRTGGIPSMIDDGKSGLLFTPGNASELEEAVTRIWENPKLASELSVHERVRAGSLHDRDKNYERLLEIYSAVLSDGSKK